jgi:hypothetical protein
MVPWLGLVVTTTIMPFVITEESELFYIKFTGVVTAGDLVEAAAVAWAAEKPKAVTPPRITDLSEATSMEIDFKAVWQLAENRKSKSFPNAFKSAIVAPKDHLLGFARMFQTLNDHPQITIRIFRDLPSAREWIGEK